MFERIRIWWGLAIACAAAVLWAVDLTILEPLTEPSRHLPDGLAENNTYWARDLRVMAIVAALGGMVLVLRGDRRRSWVAVAGAVAWLGADVGLDRLDVRGVTATVVIAVVACGVLLTGGALSRVAGGPEVGGRAALGLLASVTAALAPLAAAIESPSDTEAGLTPAAVAAATGLVLAALGCALAAGPAPSGRRALAAVAFVVIAVGLIVAARLASPGPGLRALVEVLLGVVGLTAVALFSRGWPAADDLLASLGFGLAALVLYPVLTLGSAVVMMMSGQPARYLTELAGNSAVNAADSDVILAFAGVLAGLAFGFAVLGFARPAGAVGAPVTAAPVASGG